MHRTVVPTQSTRRIFGLFLRNRFVGQGELFPAVGIAQNRPTRQDEVDERVRQVKTAKRAARMQAANLAFDVSLGNKLRSPAGEKERLYKSRTDRLDSKVLDDDIVQMSVGHRCSQHLVDAPPILRVPRILTADIQIDVTQVANRSAAAIL